MKKIKTTKDDVAEVKADDLINPLFVREGLKVREAIVSLPGIYRFSPDTLVDEAGRLLESGIKSVLLFGIPEHKNKNGSAAYEKDSLVAGAVKKIKQNFPELVVMTDVCLCAYTSHGHCGVIKQGQRNISHRETLDALSKMALTHASAGADYVAPSAMAKNQVSIIRKALDTKGFKQTKIMGYSAKFASNFYGPFREAVDSFPAFGDRSGYQLGFQSSKAALKEIAQDIKEGADIVMVKPALAYLDIIKEASTRFKFPLAAYNVSGEYAMIKSAAANGLFDEKKAVFEILTSIKRAGADLIITYYAKDIARWLKQA